MKDERYDELKRRSDELIRRGNEKSEKGSHHALRRDRLSRKAIDKFGENTGNPAAMTCDLKAARMLGKKWGYTEEVIDLMEQAKLHDVEARDAYSHGEEIYRLKREIDAELKKK